MNHEIIPMDWGKEPTFLAFPPSRPGDPCIQYFYKDPNHIPEIFYQSMGRKKPIFEMASNRSPFNQGMERVFSQEELAQLSVPLSIRVERAIEFGDLKGAKELCMDVLAEWLPIHELYRNWIASTLAYINRDYGEVESHRALFFSLNHVLRRFSTELEQNNLKEFVELLARICRWDCGSFLVVEERSNIVFHLCPCGSGLDLPLFCTICQVLEEVVGGWGATRRFAVNRGKGYNKNRCEVFINKNLLPV